MHSAANLGQLELPHICDSRTTSPVLLHCRHGPSSFWIWNSSSRLTCSVDAPITRRCPFASASRMPAAAASSNSTHLEVSTVSTSITSKSPTSVSTISTNVNAVSASRVMPVD